MQKHILVLAPKYLIIAIYNVKTMKGQAYMCFFLVLVFYRVPDFQHFLYKDSRRQKQIWVLLQRNGCPGLPVITIISICNSFTVGGQVCMCLW